MVFIIVCACLAMLVSNCEAHGRLNIPAGRSTAWRFGFKTLINYDDNQLFCGGKDHQINLGYKCGVCGDPWDASQPRENEMGGKYGKGVITGKYAKGDDIQLQVQLTQTHKGFFEFRLCPQPDGDQDCLNQYLLTLLGGTPSDPQQEDLPTRFYPRFGSVVYDIKGKLPDDVECTNCMLQWRYHAGNDFGTCDNGDQLVGCGPQEEFYACADISITAPSDKHGNSSTTKALPTPPWPSKHSPTKQSTTTSMPSKQSSPTSIPTKFPFPLPTKTPSTEKPIAKGAAAYLKSSVSLLIGSIFMFTLS